MTQSLQNCCIAGTGQSEFARCGGIQDRSQFQITAEAILAALADSGIKPAEVDGLTSFSNDSNDAPLMQVSGTRRATYSSGSLLIAETDATLFEWLGISPDKIEGFRKGGVI